MPVNSTANKPLWLRIVRRTLAVLTGFILLLLIVTGSLAIFYSNLPWSGGRLTLAAVFGVFGVWAVWFSYKRSVKLMFVVSWVAVAAWFAVIPPSHYRDWAIPVAVLPHAEIEGDQVTFTGYRNFEFRARRDYDPNYYERTVNLSEIESLDFIVSYWKPGPVAHTWVSFNFENSPPVSISIEIRPEIDERYDPVASIFRQYELIYVVGDERDLIRWRTNYRDEDVYLYRINASKEAVRQLFEVYVERINEIYDRPEWYNLLKSNCALNIIRYANRVGREGGFDIRHLLNGWMDRYFYSVGLVDTSMPFRELRALSRVNDAAMVANEDPDFSKAIRQNLPNM